MHTGPSKRAVRFDLSSNAIIPPSPMSHERTRRHASHKRAVLSSQKITGEVGYLPASSSPRHEARKHRGHSRPLSFPSTLLSAPSLSLRSNRISYDFLDPPSTLQGRYPLGMLFAPISGSLSSAPLHIRITTKAGYFPWSLAVIAHGAPTVADILAGIYKGLQIPVTKEEYSTLSWHEQRSVAEAFERRCIMRGFLASKEEVKRGLRRIDFLAGSTRFKGLKVGQTWELFVG